MKELLFPLSGSSYFSGLLLAKSMQGEEGGIALHISHFREMPFCLHAHASVLRTGWSAIARVSEGYS